MSKPVRVAEGVYRRGKSLSIVYNVKTPEGKRKQVWESGFDTVRDAKEARAQRLAATAGTLHSVDRNLTVTEWLDKWYGIESIRWRESTRMNRRTQKQHAQDFLGDVKLKDLSDEHPAALWGELVDNIGMATSSAKEVLKAFCQAVRYAVETDILPRDPFKRFKIPRVLVAPRKLLTDAEVEHLMQSTHGKYSHAIWRILADTGLRSGEAMALDWEDVDLERMTVSVTKTLTKSKGDCHVGVGAPKSPKSIRTVPLTPEAVDALRAHRALHLRRQLRADAWQESGRIFANERGGLLVAGDHRDMFKNPLREVGADWARIHDLRHYYGSTLVSLGLNVKEVQEMMGHSSAQVTLDLYCKVTPGVVDRVRDALGRRASGI